MKVLVTGCNGLLGQNLLVSGASRRDIQLFGIGQKPSPALPQFLHGYDSLDLSERGHVWDAVAKFRPDFIINAAAMTDVDGCERNPERNDRVNRDAVGHLAETGIPLAHVSTDYVFDGMGGPYREEHPVRPLSRYGKSKLESEVLARSRSPRSFVARTMWLWGKAEGVKKSFAEFVRESLAAGKPVRVVTDQTGNPTLAFDLALGIWALIEHGRAGIYHVAGGDRMSRFEWARTIAEFYRLDPALIQPVATPDLKLDAPRPLQSGLLCDKLFRDTGFKPRGAMEQLEWWRDHAPAASPF